jgi:hypothetical protein
MVSVPRHRRNRKIRRTGQRVAPPQAAKVAQEAGKAAPAIAVAGALTVTPQVHKPAPHRRAAAKQVAHLDGHLARRLRSGNTMSGIAQRFYGQDAARPWLYRVNCAAIIDPGLIPPGRYWMSRLIRLPHSRPTVAISAARTCHGMLRAARWVARKCLFPAPPAAAPRGRLPGMRATGRAGTTGARQASDVSVGRPASTGARACMVAIRHSLLAEREVCT